MKKRKLLAFGLLAGFLNGFFGSGGGVAVVLTLEKGLQLPPKKAHATAVFVILPLCIVSILVYSTSLTLDWTLLTEASIGGILGGFIGAKLLNRLPDRYIHKIFGVILIVAAIRMVVS